MAFAGAMVQARAIVGFDSRYEGCEAVKDMWVNLSQCREI